MFEENEISKNAFGGTELIKRGLAEYFHESYSEDFQVISSRIRELDENKIRILHLHDLPFDPELSHLKDKSSRDRFHKLVFVSNWQQQQFETNLGVPIDNKSIVIENHVEHEIRKNWHRDTKKIKLIYTSTPHRGLDILVEVFEELCKKYDNLELDVFSSFEIYGWKEADKQFQTLFDKCRNHSNINYHGFQPNSVVHKALENSDIFAYPSTWQETSCRSLIEAMMVGLVCVHPNLAALPETSGGLTNMYQWSGNKLEHAKNFYDALDHIIQNIKSEYYRNDKSIVRINKADFLHVYTKRRFYIDNIIPKWKNLIDDELGFNYCTLESRKIPKPSFSFNTSSS